MGATVMKHQSTINSLRRKDNMWIYKNPQGLLLLEDELNERRKKRSARHRSSPKQLAQLANPSTPAKESFHNENTPSPIIRLESSISTKEALIPIAQKIAVTDAQRSTSSIPSKERPEKAVPDNISKQQPPKLEKRKSLVEERSKMLMANEPKDKVVPKLRRTVVPQVKKTPTESPNFLLDAKQRLSSVRQKADESSASSSKQATEAPKNKKGLVSSFVSVYETSSSSPEVTPTGNNSRLLSRASTSKILTGPREPLSRSKSSMAVQPSTLKSPSIKSPVQMEPPSPATTLSSPELVTPASNAMSGGSYFSIIPSRSEVLVASPRCYDTFSSLVDKYEPIQKSERDERPVEPSTSSEINVYLPQLSPEISFKEDLLDVPEQENSVEEEKEQETLAVLERPNVPKRVSFSECLLTYIPEQPDDDSCSEASFSEEFPPSVPIASPTMHTIPARQLLLQQEAPPTSSNNPMLTFAQTLNEELTEAKSLLVAERKVNATPSRDKYVPAVVKRVSKKLEEAPPVMVKRPSLANINTPQKLSNKLLDMFQHKITPQPQISKFTAAGTMEHQRPRELVHLTKTRPRKPPSLKKPTFPAATAQPHWRERATKKKYEFVV